MSIFFIFALFTIGLFIGSFLNVLIDRLPRNEKITGRSYCESCKKTLTWKDLIPVISFVYLHGKCRYCKTKLPLYYPFVEIVTGVMFALTFGIMNYESGIMDLLTLAYSLFIVSIMTAIFFADLKHGIIPDKILLAGILVSLPVIFIIHNSLFMIQIASAIGAFGFMLLLYLVTKGKGMGFGDVKLAFLMGLILGFPGIFYSIYLAFLTGGVFAIILVLWKKRGLKSQVPFGPFLVGNFLLVFYFYPQIDKLAKSLIS